MKKPYKKVPRRMVTFQTTDDQEIWLRGQLGQSNRELKRVTGQTDGQIHYRLRVLKHALELETSLRGAWRNGSHPLFDKIMRDYKSVMMADLKRRVIPVLTHPTPETVEVD